MNLLSPNMRSDTNSRLPIELESMIDRAYLPQLENFNVPNDRRMLVVFSGGNAIGKSSISRHLSHSLKALVLENDEIKRAIRSIGAGIDEGEIHPITWRYSLSLYARIDQLSPNHLIVRDGVIDWYYDKILPLFKEQNYRLFVIGSDLSEDFQINLIKSRGDTDAISVDRQLELLQDHAIHIPRFRKKHAVDYMVTDDNFGKWDMVASAVKENYGS